MIQAKKISYSIQGKTILQPSDITLRGGEFVAIIGPNGAGKSTLMQLLARVYAPTSGSIALLGKTLSNWKTQELAKHRAMLAQHSEVNFPYTVEEIIELALLYAQVPKRKQEEVIEGVLAEVDLSQTKHRMFESLSGGERQRIHLARVLAQLEVGAAAEEQCLLLDEPLNNLDIKHQYRILDVCANSARLGRSVAIIAHDINLAIESADKVVCMKNGKIITQGVPKDTIDLEVLERLYDIPFEVLTSYEGTRFFKPKQQIEHKQNIDRHDHSTA